MELCAYLSIRKLETTLSAKFKKDFDSFKYVFHKKYNGNKITEKSVISGIHKKLNKTVQEIKHEA